MGSRAGLAVQLRRSFKATGVLGVLGELMIFNGSPGHLRSDDLGDDGPESIADAIPKIFGPTGAQMLWIVPGSPWQNGYAPNLNRALRDELLNQKSIDEPLSKTLDTNRLWRLELLTGFPARRGGLLPAKHRDPADR